MLTTKPRRTSYLIVACLLIGVIFYLSLGPDAQSHRIHDRLTSEWGTENTRMQRPVVGGKSEEQAEEASTGFNEMVFSFQNDLTQYDQPQELTSFANLPPKFLDPIAKSHGPTFSTYLCTRNSSLYDPYFLSTEQLVYRTLWKPDTATIEGYPFTVFVAPFIAQEQRDLLRGAGANVVELSLIDWKPTVNIFARWRDLFSKLHMWNQTQFSLIAFLDSDAFPLKPLDDIFEISNLQRCKAELLTNSEDKAMEDEICDYVFSGVRMMYVQEINVGVTVFNPNKAMHKRLVRESSDPNNFDNNMAEQAFLNKYFGQDSPFPTQFIPREYNGFFANADEEDKLKVLHEKLWAFTGGATWAEGMFENTHKEMISFYESEVFKKRRKVEAGKLSKRSKHLIEHETQ